MAKEKKKKIQRAYSQPKKRGRKSNQEKIEIQRRAEYNLEFYKENRKEYAALVRKANARWKNIEKNGLESAAIDEARAARRGKKYFSLKDFKDENAMEELQVLRDFLGDQTASVRGARYYTETVIQNKEFQNLYGRSWEETKEGVRISNYNETFASMYGEDFVKRVRSNYRRIEDDYAKLMAAGVLSEAFDSETLITLMFDAAVEGQHMEERNWEGENATAPDPEIARAKAILDFYQDEFKKKERYFNRTAAEAEILYVRGTGYYDAFMAGRVF